MLSESIPSVKEHVEILFANSDVIPVSHRK